VANNADEGGGAFLWGTLIGTLVGALVALLFAPRSGKQTLEGLEQAATDARRQIEGESVQESLAAAKAEARRLKQDQ
jgi:gas vesicle protein